MAVTVPYFKNPTLLSPQASFSNRSVKQKEKGLGDRQWNTLIKIHCFPLRIKKTVKRMRRRMRRNRNRSVADPLWNLLFHRTRPAVYPKRQIAKVNREPGVHGTTCQIPHHYQMEQKVHLAHSCSGMEVHVNSDVMWRSNVTTSASTVLSAALKSCLSRQPTRDVTRRIFGTGFTL